MSRWQEQFFGRFIAHIEPVFTVMSITVLTLRELADKRHQQEEVSQDATSVRPEDEPEQVALQARARSC
jgi:hypothetical protein